MHDPNSLLRGALQIEVISKIYAQIEKIQALLLEFNSQKKLLHNTRLDVLSLIYIVLNNKNKWNTYKIYKSQKDNSYMHRKIYENFKFN